MTSIGLIDSLAYTYVYGILVQVYKTQGKIRLFSWHTPTYTHHHMDLILTPCPYIFRIRLSCVLTVCAFLYEAQMQIARDANNICHHLQVEEYCRLA